jgi:hypothetical protein
VDEQAYQEEIARLEQANQELRAEGERLKRLLEEALRATKRQAAPFSRRNPKANPQKPGRKAGSQYSRQGRRSVPEKVDEVIEVPLPEKCPQCGSGVEETGVVSQYQSEIPLPWVEQIEFRIHQGCCKNCGQRVEGRHPRQTSAAGIESSQLGPRAVAWGQLEARLDRALDRRWRSSANRRLANHLSRERDAVFTFLYCPGMEATNWRVEVGHSSHGGRTQGL